MKALLIVCLLLLSGCVAPAKDLYPAKNCDDVKTIVIVSHGWHTGFVIDAHDLRGYLPAVQQDFDGARYLEIGWGDKGFYQTEKITSGLTLQAIFWPTDSILHVVGLMDTPQTEFPHSEIFQVQISNDGLLALLQYLQATFETSDGQPISSDNGLYGWSRFYEASGKYHLFKTCNHWVARGLRQTGFPITYPYAATAGNVMFQVENFAADPLKCSQ
jgi:uncharacterized protein (TIGR02117 family)